MTVHFFGATSSSSCAIYALKKAAEENKDKFSAEAICTVMDNFYVDDCLKSVSTERQAIALCKELCRLCAQGGFRLTKWISNSRDVLASIPKEDRAKEIKSLDLDSEDLPIERALGIQWSVEDDKFTFKVALKPQACTRRGILSVVSSVYDPLGFIAPFIFTAKLILQELCKLKYGWDEKVPDGFIQPWQNWLADLRTVENFSISRCIKPPSFGKIKWAQLHHFCDASELGYGTVSYLRLTNTQDQVHVAFVMGKARVAPLKQITIPRMELTAAMLAVRMERMLTSELHLQLDRSVFWTDSTAVLKYIKNETKRFQTFVANRISAIREVSDVKQWRYINTKDNPADFASRGLTAEALIRSDLWKRGPVFLERAEQEWPQLDN